MKLDVSTIADAMKPILRGVVDRHSKDGFEFWVDHLATNLARAILAKIAVLTPPSEPSKYG